MLLSSISLPAALLTINDDAFEKCSSLKSIKLPVGVTSVGSDAFLECGSLSHVELSVALKKLGGEAFAKCPSLREVVLNSPAPPSITRTTFKDVVSCTFWIPKGCQPLYAANKDWAKVYVIKEKE